MSDSINEQRCERNGLPISGCAASEYDCAKFGVCAASQPEPATLRITTYGGGKTVQHWQLRYGNLFLADTSVQAHVEQWRQLVAAVPSVSTDIADEKPLTLREMQQTQPWTAPYSPAFEFSKSGQNQYVGPEQHRSLMHDLMHVTKAVGILSSIAEWADHGNVRTERVDQDEYEGRIADLVMCALHMANNPPCGYETFDLHRAVVERVERVNQTEWRRRG